MVAARIGLFELPDSLMLVRIKNIENLTYQAKENSIINLAVRGERGPSKCKRMHTGGEGLCYCECLLCI